MRANQVSIKIQRFGEQVPEELAEYENLTISVYADSSNIYAALCGAFQEALDEVSKWQSTPQISRQETYDTVENSKNFMPKRYLTEKTISEMGFDIGLGKTAEEAFDARRQTF